MRFKFRAFYKKTNTMVVSEKLESINFETKTVGAYIDQGERGFYRLRLSDFEVMQWTGEKEIYEHDIVRQGRNIGVVKYANEYCRFYVDWLPPVEFGLRSELWYVRDDLEVIGNIYENPELIGRMASDSTAILSESEAE